MDIVDQYRDVVKVVVSEKDTGIYDGMNKGIERSSGEYVAFLNSDDAYFEDTVARLESFAENKSASIIYGNIQKERKLDGELLTRVEKPSLDTMPQTMGVFHPATFVKRKLFDTYGSYDLRFKQAADYHWFLRAYLDGADFAYLDHVLTRFSLGGVSNHSCETYREAALIQEELSTGYHLKMQELHHICLKKQARLRLISKLSQWPIFKSIYRSRIKKRWR
jgi:glycosyltransferase involved in cell wall biosynthesis